MSSAGTVTMEKAIPNDTVINKELIKDYIMLKGIFKQTTRSHMLVVNAIIDSFEPNTTVFISTYETLSEKLNLSYSTVLRTFKILMENGIIERIDKSVYRFNNALIRQEPTMLQVTYSEEGVD